MVEVTHISTHGFWILLPAGEVFVSFASFPWFREATIAQIQTVTLLHSDHLYWPMLDVDPSLDTIHNPERYPLVSRVSSKDSPQRKADAGAVRERPKGKRRTTRR